MQTETSRGPLTGPEADGPVPAGGPRWRALLEMRWRARLQEVTELALAYHEAAAAAGHGGSGEGRLQVERLLRLQRLLRRTVTSRRALADTEEALARLSAGRYGRCESCAGAIPARRLAATPETRYCARCARGWGR
jgi:RNA polymerase-binding transcription factor DksA